MHQIDESHITDFGRRLVRLQEVVSEITAKHSNGMPLRGTFLAANAPYTNLLAFRDLVRSVAGDLIWLDGYADQEVLDVIAGAANAQHHSITVVRKGHLDERLRRAAAHLREEITAKGVSFDFITVPEAAWTAHARWLVTETEAWTLPSASALKKADEIRRSSNPSAARIHVLSMLNVGTSVVGGRSRPVA